MDSGAGPANSRPRFLQLSDVAEVLNISAAQVYALVRRGDLRAIKIGGRGQWRVEESELDAYIQRSYAVTQDFITRHPFGAEDEDSGSDFSAEPLEPAVRPGRSHEHDGGERDDAP